VTQKEPFLTGFSKHLYGSAKRSKQRSIQLFRKKALRDSTSSFARLFENILPAAWLAGIDPTRRIRDFPLILVYWAWFAQILERNASCSKALSMIQSWSVAAGLAGPKGGTSGYPPRRHTPVELRRLRPYHRHCGSQPNTGGGSHTDYRDASGRLTGAAATQASGTGSSSTTYRDRSCRIEGRAETRTSSGVGTTTQYRDASGGSPTARSPAAARRDRPPAPSVTPRDGSPLPAPCPGNAPAQRRFLCRRRP